MGQTLTNGIYLPDEGEVRCYEGLASNWTTLDAVIGGYRAHVANENIHITSAERSKWDNGVSQAYVLRYASVSLTALGTVAFSALDNTDNIKIGDKVLDSEGKLFALTAVDTESSTATLSALLIDLADDSDVVHKAGAETISGSKTFAASIKGYNSDSTQNTVSIDLRTSKVARGNTQDGSDIFSLGFRDKNNESLMSFSCIKRSTGATAEYHTVYSVDNSDNSISRSFSFNLNKDGLGSLQPEENNQISLGTSSKKWAALNGLNPGVLFMPQDRTARLDISSYFTNTASGATNRYTPLNDGYIFLSLTDVVSVQCFSQNTSNLTHYGQTFARASAGQLYCLFPVRKNDNFGCQWYTTSAAVTVSNAFFIPCKGNV